MFIYLVSILVQFDFDQVGEFTRQTGVINKCVEKAECN